MRADFPYVYPLSRSEALRLDETQMHEDSFRENVKCAWDIEKAVRDCSGEGKTVLAEGCAQSILEAYGFKRVRFVLSNSLGEMAQPRQISEEARQWATEIYVPPDGKRNRRFAVKTSAPLLEAFIRQAQAAYQALGLFGPEHCAGDPFKLNYEGKVLVLSPDTLRESHWNPREQLWLGQSGFGCSPTPEARRSTPSAWATGRKRAGTDMISTACWTSDFCPTGRRKSWRSSRALSRNNRKPLRRNGDDVTL